MNHDGERIEGLRDPLRRQALDFGAVALDGWAEYRKTQTIWARRMPLRFEVVTLAGVIGGQPGDWLAVGAAGEMYPIAADVFDQTYEAVGDDDA